MKSIYESRLEKTQTAINSGLEAVQIMSQKKSTAGTEFQSLAVQGKKLLTLQQPGNMTKNSSNLLE